MYSQNRYKNHIDDIQRYRAIAMKLMYESAPIDALINSVVDTPCHGRDLVFKYIFPFAYVPDTTTSAKPFITMEIAIPRVENRTFKDMRLFTYIFCHQNIVQQKDGLLFDLLAEEVDKLLNGNDSFGLGALELRNLADFSPMQRWHGLVMQYNSKSFNRPAK